MESLNVKGDVPKLSDSESEGMGVGELLAIFMAHRLLIFFIVLCSLVIGVAWIFVATPKYMADGLVQVEEKPSGSMSALKELQPLLGDSTTVAAELEILNSRMVLGRVIEKLKLDIEVKPKYFPIFGNAVARKYSGDGVNDAILGLSSYAWGGEKLKVDGLDVPRSFLNKPLTLIARDAGRFDLLDGDDQILLSGVIGERVSRNGFSIFVSQFVARPSTEFQLSRKSLEVSADKLRRRYDIKELGKKSGVLAGTITGPDKDENERILDEILKTYVRQNVDRRSAEAENTLKFLEMQLPALKKEMEAAESAYNSYRQTRGSLDLTVETQGVLQSIVEVDNQIVALKQERDEVRQSFTNEHPRVQAIDQRLERLKERRKQFEVEVGKLPDTQQKVLRLARDVEVSTNLYTDLVNTAQQLRVSKAGTVGDVRVIDFAVSSAEPVGLKPHVILLLSIFGGLGVSAAYIWLKRALRVVVEDPEVIEAQLGLPVYATLPHSEDEAINGTKQRAGLRAAELLAIAKPDDDAVESLRALRTTIHFALLDAARKSILITGSSPGLGKSFVSKNLGVVLSQTGSRVVIVDADLRRGHINKEFGLRREIGISEYVAGSATIEEIIKPTSVPNLFVVTTGQIPPNPSELLMHLRFEQLLNQLEERFDSVIVDAPPILAVSDAAIIGRQVGATLMVARAGHHPIQELEQAVKRLSQAGVQVKGFVFNDLDTERQRYRYGYKGYVYRYSYKNDSQK